MLILKPVAPSVALTLQGASRLSMSMVLKSSLVMTLGVTGLRMDMLPQGSLTMSLVGQARMTMLLEADAEIRLALASVIVVPGGEPGTSYTHVQAVPSSTWTINHNLGYNPAVELMTVGGSEFEADVLHTSINQTIVYTTLPIAGKARLT